MASGNSAARAPLLLSSSCLITTTQGNKRAEKRARADTERYTRERETGVFCAVKCDVLSCDLNFESLFGEDFFAIPETALSFGHGRKRNRNFFPFFWG